MLQYGRGLSEIVLTGNGSDVHSLWPVDASEVRIKRDNDGELILGQYKPTWGEPKWFERQDLLLYNLANPEKDDPHGKPLIRSCQWLANILLIMENAVRQMWQRHGAPSFAITAYVDPNTLAPTAGENVQTEIDGVKSGITSEWRKGMVDRWQQEGIRDFILAGTFKVDFAAIGTPMITMVLVSLTMWYLMSTRRRIGRRTGAVFLAAYAVFLAIEVGAAIM